MGRLARRHLFHRKVRFAVTRRGIVSALAEAAAREEDRARAAAVAGAKVELAEARATLEKSGPSTLTGPGKPVATTSFGGTAVRVGRIIGGGTLAEPSADADSRILETRVALRPGKPLSREL